MRSAEDLLKEGFRLHGQGDLAGAAAIYDAVLGHAPDDPNTLYAYGTLAVAQGAPGMGAHLLRTAATLSPNWAPTWVNLGIAYKALDKDEAARQCFDKAIELEPNSPEALSNLSGWYINRGTAEKAEEYARKALRFADTPQSHNHLALALLEQGRFDEAWPHYAKRWELPERQKDKRPFACPKWDGSPVKRLAIHGEQGLGDEILFMSCFRDVQKRAEYVAVECATRLVPWFAASLKVPCYGTHAEMMAAEAPFDAYVAMGDLPGLVGAPDGKPYLDRPAKPVKRRVGYAWKGGTAKTNKKARSLSQDALAPILSVPGYDFVSVQYDAGNRQDFDSLNARIASCEQIVTVCQTALHQAGAMGIPCKAIVPKECAWRYSPAFGERMPWYGSVKLYRENAIQRIADDLRRSVLH